MPNRSHTIHMGDEVVQPVSWFQRCFRECICDLNHLYIRCPQFWEYGKEDYSLIYKYGENLVIAYLRGIFDNRRIAVLHSFSNSGYTCYDIPCPGSDPNVEHSRDTVEIFNTDY
ncbi:unnamed protein product [Rotaria sp. Silwood2]|nr:unnamed protein product [Rotaria sp. Silwood2]CAF4450167.1 unnamed protein product [Rotaria sp. Silwood2]